MFIVQTGLEFYRAGYGFVKFTSAVDCIISESGTDI